MNFKVKTFLKHSDCIEGFFEKNSNRYMKLNSELIKQRRMNMRKLATNVTLNNDNNGILIEGYEDDKELLHPDGITFEQFEEEQRNEFVEETKACGAEFYPDSSEGWITEMQKEYGEDVVERIKEIIEQIHL